MDVVVVPFIDARKWPVKGFRNRDSNLCKALLSDSRVDRVIVLNHPGAYPEFLWKNRVWKSLRKLSDRRRSYTITELMDRLFVVDVFGAGLFKRLQYRDRWLDYSWGQTAFRKVFQSAMQDLAVNDYQLFVFSPLGIKAFNALSPRKRTFFAVDNWLELPQRHGIREVVQDAYKYVQSTADLIVTTAKPLNIVFEPRQQGVVAVSNGVDRDELRREFAGVIPAFEGTVLGYIGIIESRIDLDLVKQLSESFTDATIVIAGRVLDREVAAQLSSLANIKLIGDIPHPHLGTLIRTFDVCLIPHKVNPLTQSQSPLKLREYLAAGRRVVSTRTGGVEPIEGYVKVADTCHEFIDSVRLFLSEEQGEEFQVPDSWLWKSKASQIIDMLES